MKKGEIHDVITKPKNKSPRRRNFRIILNINKIVNRLRLSHLNLLKINDMAEVKKVNEDKLKALQLTMEKMEKNIWERRSNENGRWCH